MAKMRTERLAKQLMLWGAIAVGLLIVIFLARATWDVYGKMAEAKTLEDAAAENKAELATRKTELQANLEELATPRGVEAEIRSRYPVVKPGEEEFVFVDSSGTSSTQVAKPPSGFWSGLWRLLGW